jgi:hypothetical protein
MNKANKGTKLNDAPGALCAVLAYDPSTPRAHQRGGGTCEAPMLDPDIGPEAPRIASQNSNTRSGTTSMRLLFLSSVENSI